VREAGFFFFFPRNCDGGADLDVLVSRTYFSFVQSFLNPLMFFKGFLLFHLWALDPASCCFALLCTDCHSFFCFVWFGFGMALTDTKDELYFFSAAKTHTYFFFV
jgi:hypothetical protein